MDQWYYGKDGQQQGPVDLETIRSLMSTGQLASGDLVWKEGMANWTAISQIPELTPQNTQQNYSQGGQTGGYQQGGYQQGRQQGGYVPGCQGTSLPGDPTKNGMAVTSMILGIVSLFPWCVCYGVISFGCGIAAIILSRSGAKSQQPGMAKAGLICGILGILLGVVGLILGVLVAIGTINANQWQNYQ